MKYTYWKCKLLANITWRSTQKAMQLWGFCLVCRSTFWFRIRICIQIDAYKSMGDSFAQHKVPSVIQICSNTASKQFSECAFHNIPVLFAFAPYVIPSLLYMYVYCVYISAESINVQKQFKLASIACQCICSAFSMSHSLSCSLLTHTYVDIIQEK